MRFYKEKGEKVMKKFTKLICLILTFAIIAGAGVLNVNLGQFVSAADTFQLVTGSTLKVDTASATLVNLVPGITVGTVRGNFVTDVTVYDANGATAGDSAMIGTGYTIEDEDGNTITAVVVGDVTGDGMLSSPDFIAIKQYMKGITSLDQYSILAADVTGDGMVSSSDSVGVKTTFAGESDIYSSYYGKAFVITKSIPMYASAANALAGTSSTGTAAAGTYYVHRSYPAGLDGMYYLTTTSAATGTGFWIDPADMGTVADSSEAESSEPDSSEADSSEVVTGTAYVVVAEINKYATSTDAAAQTNATGTVTPGTYYIYNKYPDGLNGMYNISSDTTGASAGFWINPAENTTATGTPYEIVVTVNSYPTSTDAAAQTNANGTVEPGTYYVYNKYPDGYNGMYNITTDPTGESGGYWINPAENTVATAATYIVKQTINKYSSAADAAAQTNATGTVAAGTYYIYNNYPNGYNGMYNITTDPTGATVGYWINPAENGDVATATTYVLTQDMPKYASSADAANQQNSTGTATAGTYYIYNSYPDGLNGMYNLTTDSTGATAGFWINPADATIGTDGTITLVRPVNKYGYAADAINQTNITGTATAGTYYIYNNYPNGLNGMYNITTDSTGATAGFWINPKENTTGKLNYDTVKAIWFSQYDLANVYVSSGSQNTQSAFRYRIKQTMTAVKNSGYNTVIVQVRPNGDACYSSSLFPWSKYVVGSYGKTASYDPFQIIIEEAYAQALSVHAWVNPMRLMSTSEITSVSSDYIIKQWYDDSEKNGTYIVAVDGMYYLNPGYADVRNLIINGVTEICENYAVDGIHFDDYFYPDGVTTSFDQEAFEASGQASRATWRKLCVDAFVKGTYNAVKAVDSELIFGISPAGSITNNMNYLYADVKKWCSTSGYVDYIAPQIYWGFEHTYSPFDEVLAEWEALMTNANIKLIPALTLAKAYGETDTYDGTEWTDNKDVIKRQMELANTCTNFGGVMVFSLADFYNPANNSYVGNLTYERENYEPVLKAMYGG